MRVASVGASSGPQVVDNGFSESHEGPMRGRLSTVLQETLVTTLETRRPNPRGIGDYRFRGTPKSVAPADR